MKKNNLLSNLGEKIKNRRIELKITQEELSKLTGYSDRSSITKIEKGKVDLTLSKLKEFAKVLKVSPEYLMGYKESENIIDFGVRLKAALKRKNMSQTKLSEISGINTSTISEYISGRYEPNRNRITEFANILDVNEVWLMGYDVPMERDAIKKEVDPYFVDTSVLTPEELAEFEKVTGVNKQLFFNDVDDEHDMAVFKRAVIDILIKQRENKK
ncbi:helix-turn-helix domain-containing protein [Leptotrichia trevisanii]|uniref:helix-turn-helix domain-containing protein n=1 Tax=Leptotrichia trevisanii TaxID=109328 RepID=UPI0003F5620E|nr:helix-turn-helix transcriptional regulator [Leptotrichia trevisanii]